MFFFHTVEIPKKTQIENTQVNPSVYKYRYCHASATMRLLHISIEHEMLVEHGETNCEKITWQTKSEAKHKYWIASLFAA